MDFLYSQLFARIPYPTESQAGKTVVVTGSNVGLGKEAARHFARLGASKIILAVRSIEKGAAAKSDIVNTTGISDDVIQIWRLDMGSYASVKSFAERVSELKRVDTFIANAGIATDKYSLMEGSESTITVNVISTFLLAFLISPKLRETAAKFNVRPNLTITASDVHKWAKFEERKAPEGQIFDTLSDESKWENFKGDRYNVSKLLELFVVRAFAERYPAESLPYTLDCVTPGLCHSELGREAGLAFYIFKLLLARSTEVGGRTLFIAATQESNAHGTYMADGKIEEPSPFVRSKEGKITQDRVWNELVAKLETIQPGIMKSI